AVTCDYFGDGNSGGDTLDLNFQGMVEDIENIYLYSKDKYRIQKYALVGLRVGANTALAAQGRIHDVQNLIMIEPVLNLIDVIKTGLRANLTNQMTIHKKILKTRDMLFQDIKNGNPVNMDGFLVGKNLWDSFEKTGTLLGDPEFGGKAVIISMDNNAKINEQYASLAHQFKRGTVIKIEREFIWTGWKYYNPSPPIFMETILNELVRE
ncbi:MAG: hypothetical protein ACP5EQ_08030, partial [Candidatus Cloacimonadia bacterium]